MPTRRDSARVDALGSPAKPAGNPRGTRIINPTHPFLLFHGQDVGPGSALYNRMVPTGSPLHPVYSRLVTTVQATPATVGVWEHPATMGYVRDIVDVAFRAVIEEHGTTTPTYAPAAIAALKDLLFSSTSGTAPWPARENVYQPSPLGDAHWIRRKTFKSCFFVTAVALCYDWLFEFMSPDEALSIRSFLHACAEVTLQAHFPANPGGRARHYHQFKGAATNYTQSAACQIAMALTATEPESDGSGGQAVWSYLQEALVSPVFPDSAAESSENDGYFPNIFSVGPPNTGTHHAPFGDIDIQISNALDKIRLAWLDAISPDGSADEEHLYARQLTLCLLPAHAALINDLGPGLNHKDIISGTHVLGTPDWYCRSFLADRYPFTGDNDDSYPSASPVPSNHTDGNAYDSRFPPYLYLIVRDHIADQEAKDFLYWGLKRVRNEYDTRTGNTPAHSFGYGHLADQNREADDLLLFMRSKVFHCLFGPEPSQEPATCPKRIFSGFFRDDEGIDDTTNPPGGVGSLQDQFSNEHASRFVSIDTPDGTGGRFYLHNSPDPSWKPMALQYIVKDEWFHHGHEDSGHIDLAYEKFFFLMDRGRANGSSLGCTDEHNLVLRLQGNGLPYELGTTNAYYCPQFPNLTPTLLGRYRSEVKEKHLAEGADFLQAEHRYAWGGNATNPNSQAQAPLYMQHAERSILFIKSPSDPYVLVLDDISIDGTTAYRYRQSFLGPNPFSPTSGSAPFLATPLKQDITFGSPSVTHSLYAAWLHPISGLTASVAPGVLTNAALDRGATHIGGFSYGQHRRTNIDSNAGLARDSRLLLLRGGAATTTMTQTSAGTAGIGALVTWDDSSRHLALFNTYGQSAIDGPQIHKMGGKAAWFRRSPYQSGGVAAYTDWLLANGTTLIVAPFDPGEAATISLLEADIPCTAVYRSFPSRTVLEVSLSNPVSGSEITCYAPDFATVAYLNGAPVTYNRIEDHVVILIP